MGRIAEVIDELARDRGYTLGELAEEIEARGCYPKGDALRVLRGEVSNCPMLAPVVGEILGLEATAVRRLHEMVLLEGERAFLAQASSCGAV
jgi:hypothetical protein